MAAFDWNSFGMGELAGLRDDDRNARAAADARQANERSTERQMQFQHDEASTARQFAERMSNTAHWREVQDLAQAGLNPILSARHGGSSTPSVGAPSGASSSAPMQAPSQSGIGAATTAMALRRNAQEIENLKASEKLTNAQAKTEGWREKAEFENIYRVFWEAVLSEEEAKNTLPIRRQKMGHERDILKEDLQGRKLEGDIDRSDFGNIMRHLNRILGSVNSAVGIGRLFNQGLGDRQRSRDYRDRWGMQD